VGSKKSGGREGHKNWARGGEKEQIEEKTCFVSPFKSQSRHRQTKTGTGKKKGNGKKERGEQNGQAPVLARPMKYIDLKGLKGGSKCPRLVCEPKGDRTSHDGLQTGLWGNQSQKKKKGPTQKQKQGGE